MANRKQVFFGYYLKNVLNDQSATDEEYRFNKRNIRHYIHQRYDEGKREGELVFEKDGIAYLKGYYAELIEPSIENTHFESFVEFSVIDI